MIANVKPVTIKQMMNGARIFLNSLANTTGITIEAIHVTSVLIVDISPAMEVDAESPIRAVTAGTI